MGHDHDHVAPYHVPNYKTFTIEGIKELEQLQVALERRGLKDPWIRNEAWRFHPGFGTRTSRALRFFGRGVPIGILTGALATGIGYVMDDDDHAHGGHGSH